MGSNSIPETMKALVLTGPGEFEVQTLETPTPKAGEVLCKIHATAICGSDPEIVRGDIVGFWPPGYPFVAGHEWSGEVVALGPEVTRFSVGDRVAGEAHKGCGECFTCLEGKYNLCENYGITESGHRHYGFRDYGAYAQYNAYSVKSLTKLPDSVSYHEGALVDTAGITLHAMRQTGITTGGVTAVIGPGPIGVIAMRLARALGTGTVIAVGREPRLSSAADSSDKAVNFEQVDPVEAVRSLTQGFGADEAFECSGAKTTFNQAVRMVKRGGKVGLIGVPPKHVVEELPFSYLVSNEIAIFGSKANPHVSKHIVDLLASGRLRMEDLVTHTFTLEEFGEALETFISRKDGAMKVVIEPNR